MTKLEILQSVRANGVSVRGLMVLSYALSQVNIDKITKESVDYVSGIASRISAITVYFQ